MKRKINFLFYILKRILVGFLGIILSMSLTFFAIKIIPGSPFLTFKKLRPEQMEEILKKNGYKDPLVVQLFKNIKNIFFFECSSALTGESISKKLFSSDKFSSPFFLSFKIAILTTILSLLFGIIIGSIIAVKNNFFVRFIEKITSFFSIPTIIVANVTVIFVRNIFKINEGLFMKLFLPALIFSLPRIYRISQYTKELMLENLNTDYIKMLRLKGLSKRKIFFKHVLITSIIPVISQFSSLFVNLLAQSVIVESVFTIPGIGNQITNYVYQREYNGIIFLVGFFSILSITSRLIDDISLKLLNPKVNF